MTFPGRLYLPDPSRDWPGDTISAQTDRPFHRTADQPCTR
jgi:hypothetical protein